MTASNKDWYATVRGHQSLGSQARRPGSLAGLHEARKEHLSQFFTGNELAALLWSILSPALVGAIGKSDRKVGLLDNSLGSGRLLQFADPAKHILAGCDVHAPSVEAFRKAAIAAGFETDFVVAGMQEVRPKGYGAALINPPFSIQIDDPLLKPYSCTTWGRFGRHSSAVSHAYALHQALAAADVVLAILPATYLAAIATDPTPEMEARFRAAIELPAGAFDEEGTAVDVGLAVFGLADTSRPKPLRLVMSSLDDALPDLGLEIVTTTATRSPRPLDPIEIQASAPTISGEVTGNRQVRVIKDGRKLGLRFACAATNARVMNAILDDPVPPAEEHRYPVGIKFKGQGWFDLQLYLAQDDPLAAFGEFLSRIAAAGGEPSPDPAIQHYLRRASRELRRMRTPFGHVVKGGITTDPSAPLSATANRTRVLNPKQWGSPIIRAGDSVHLAPRGEGGYDVTVGGVTHALQELEIRADFTISNAPAANEWREAYPSRIEAFPQLAKAIRARMKQTRADAIASWDYQLDDVVELRMGRAGVPIWRMGCGKSRLAIAMCLMGGEHNCIAVESNLVPEMIREFESSGLDPSLWQLITSVEQCFALRKINLISYNRLRSPVCEGAGRRTYAKLLRRKFSTCVADESHLLRHLDTQQTRALWMLSPKRRYPMTGTPIVNQVQDLLPLMQWAFGDGTVLQPYGRYRPYLEPRLLRSMSYAMRGIDQFVSDFVVLEWVTREWEDGMVSGAKRQVPKVRNVEKLRRWAAPFIKRRHETEPMVAAHFKVPEPLAPRVHEIDWDDQHLAHYLRTADLFATWYRQMRDAAGDKRQNVNLIALLARIGAVQRACNFPQYIGKGNFGLAPYSPLTSKQRAIIDRAEELAEQGHKIIVYSDTPGQVELIARQLNSRGVRSVPFHGGIPINKRTHALDDEFRFGTAPVLSANILITQNGLNIYQADRALYGCRSWSSSREEQGLARLLRPQQLREVQAEFFHLKGAIDVYQAQMCAMKRDTATAALDFLTPEYDDIEFLHMDAMLDTFVRNLAERAGIDPYRYREVLRAA